MQSLVPPALCLYICLRQTFCFFAVFHHFLTSLTLNGPPFNPNPCGYGGICCYILEADSMIASRAKFGSPSPMFVHLVKTNVKCGHFTDFRTPPPPADPVAGQLVAGKGLNSGGQKLGSLQNTFSLLKNGPSFQISKNSRFFKLGIDEITRNS